MLSFLDRLTIRTRLVAATVAMLCMLGILGGFAVDRISAVNAVSTQMATNTLPSMQRLNAVQGSLLTYRKLVTSRALNMDATAAAKAQESMNAKAPEVDKLSAYYERLVSAPEERKLYDSFRANWAAYVEELTKTLEVMDQNMIEGKPRPSFAKATAFGDQAEADIAALVNFNMRAGQAMSRAADEIYGSVKTWVLSLLGFAIVAGAVAGFFIIRSITRSMRAVTVPMGGLAAGDLSVEIPYRGQKTEIGQIADAVQVFKDALIEKKHADEAAAVEAEAKVERARRLETLTATFETKVGGLVQALSSAATEMEATAQSMSATAEETDQQSVAVAAASEQAATNVQTVAGASEELSASIREIAGQVEQSSKIAGRAVEEANRTDATVGQLAEAAQRIGDVLNLISSIAAQTNLLALNATIEAARAGDAGKGFAVVASEVKNLANQTAKATEEIAGQIAGIQETTQGVVTAIRGIGGTIGEISEIAATIASAVEEQRAATQEIARNVQEAARGTQEVTANIEGVKRASADTGAAATQVLGAAGGLSQQSEALSAEVKQFLAGVKAA
ncbi:methyl-accepting chemotaxis protein [Constrictibacter sp. MBR-5]|jgi:methyl-accepting chemotaxis protein|uniref:methyl-accepting chemotaxis protein n=1 Tax=Constrictibacter sp. MBR-5 TaxID=3156467 RepID=UPI003398ED0D